MHGAGHHAWAVPREVAVGRSARPSRATPVRDFDHCTTLTRRGLHGWESFRRLSAQANVGPGRRAARRTGLLWQTPVRDDCRDSHWARVRRRGMASRSDPCSCAGGRGRAARWVDPDGAHVRCRRGLRDSPAEFGQPASAPGGRRSDGVGARLPGGARALDASSVGRSAVGPVLHDPSIHKPDRFRGA